MTDENPRQYYERIQAETLSPYAMLAQNSRGRETPVELDALQVKKV